MTITYISKPDDNMTKLAQTAFGYTGKQFSVRTGTEYQMKNYWQDGSKTSAVLVQRKGLEIYAPGPATTNPWKIEAHTRFEIPKGAFILEHVISRGKDLGVRFVVRPDEMDTLMLPSSPELTQDEQIVLVYTRGRKSSYNGISNFRFHSAKRDTGITQERWDAAKASCIEKKLLDKRGAITADGRNAVADKQDHHYKRGNHE